MENKILCGKNKLEEAIGLFESAYYDSFTETSGEISYSEHHQQEMQALLAKSGVLSHPRSSVSFKKRIAALLLAAALLCAGILGVSASKHSSAFARWFERACERFTEFFFAERDVNRAPLCIETLYFPTDIPIDYILYERYIGESETKTIWKNKTGEQIVFMQMTLDAKATVDHENAKYETQVIDGIQYFILTKKEKRFYYWNHGDYAYSLIVAEAFSEEASLLIIRSVQIAEIPTN